MANCIFPEVAYRRPCHNCSRPVAVRRTKTGRGVYHCNGELQQDRSHCDFKGSLCCRDAEHELTTAQAAQAGDPPVSTQGATGEPKGDPEPTPALAVSEDGKPTSEPPEETPDHGNQGTPRATPAKSGGSKSPGGKSGSGFGDLGDW